MNYGKEQRKQIYKVLEYIEEHLNEPLPLEKLAKASTYSAFHFQRIFKGIIGETPAAYIKRLRMENAAHLLIYEQHTPITQVAMICGFSSLSYFTASFNEYFQMSPKKWREGAYLERFSREYYDSKKSKLLSSNKKEIPPSYNYNEFRWLDLEKVKTIDIPSCKAIKRYSIGPYTEGVKEVWEDVFHWSNSRELINQDTMIFGIPRNNPYITLPEKSRYDCCIELNEDEGWNVEEEITFQFNGGKHVLYEFDEPVIYSDRNKLIECYSELYSFWLPKSGYRYLGNPIEMIQIEPVQGSLNLECKIKAIGLAIEPK